MAFLSLLDDRAKPKGSRDPLGFELVWTHFGRRVVGNLTTITSSMDNFAAALLGFYWAEQRAANLVEQDRHEHIKHSFLRYEQLTGYLRCLAGAGDILGITRVRQRLDKNEPLSLGLATGQQILSDQASYGLWGLYSSAARDTGLVEGQDRTPTALGRELAEMILAHLGAQSAVLQTLIDSGQPLRKSQLEGLAKPFIDAIRQPALQERLLECLMAGPPGHQVQRAFWHEVRAVVSDKTEGDPADYVALIKAVQARTSDPVLKQELSAIQAIERVLVAANDLFNFCRRKDGAPLSEIIEWLEGNRNYDFLPDEIPSDSQVPRRPALGQIRSLLKSGKIAGALTEVLALNRDVMKERGGAPWVEVERNGKLRVRVKTETVRIPCQEGLERHWDYDYFIGSFFSIARRQGKLADG